MALKCQQDGMQILGEFLIFLCHFLQLSLV
jgi:hypothetical protein